MQLWSGAIGISGSSASLPTFPTCIGPLRGSRNVIRSWLAHGLRCHLRYSPALLQVPTNLLDGAYRKTKESQHPCVAKPKLTNNGDMCAEQRHVRKL